MSELRRIGFLEAEEAADVRPEAVMDELLANALGYMRWARSLLDDMPAEEFWLVDPRTTWKIPCAEFELEQRLSRSVQELVTQMIRLELGGRSVAVEEAKLEVLGRALEQAVAAAGVDDETRRRIGQELRTQLRLIEGGAEG
jgi:hypothetical protein